MGMKLDVVRESLIAQMTALDGLDGEELEQEIARARAKVEIANQVNAYVANQIKTAKLVAQARGAASEELGMAVGRLLRTESRES